MTPAEFSLQPTLDSKSTENAVIRAEILAQNTHIAQTATAAQVATGYPCEGIIVSPRGTTTLNVVRLAPSTNAQLVANVHKDDVVFLTTTPTNNEGTRWLKISNSSGEVLGWIPDEYVDPGSSCPASARQ